MVSDPKEERSSRSIRKSRLPLAFAGLGVGWIMGLSLTPVVGTVLTSILGVVAGVVSGISVFDDERTKFIDAWPLALLVVGVAVGGTLGVLTRTNNYLGPMKIDSRETGPLLAGNGAAPDWQRGGLYSLDTTACNRLIGSPGFDLGGALQTSSFHWAPKVAEAFGDDPETMRKIVEILCEQ